MIDILSVLNNIPMAVEFQILPWVFVRFFLFFCVNLTSSVTDQKNDHQSKEFLIIKQILLVSTNGNYTEE